MQEQTKSKKKQEESLTDLSSLTKLKSKSKSSVNVSIRIVKLVYESLCGCGSIEVEILRTVRADSPLKDGDTVNKLLPGDKQV